MTSMEMNVLFWDTVIVPRMTLNYFNISLILLIIKLILIPKLTLLLILSIKYWKPFQCDFCSDSSGYFKQIFSWISQKNVEVILKDK